MYEDVKPAEVHSLSCLLGANVISDLSRLLLQVAFIYQAGVNASRPLVKIHTEEEEMLFTFSSFYTSHSLSPTLGLVNWLNARS